MDGVNGTTETPADDKAAANRRLIDQLLKEAEAIRFKATGWVDFYEQVFGEHGLLRKTFESTRRLREFESTVYYQQLQSWLKELRGSDHRKSHDGGRMITVRLPKPVHAALRQESHEHKTSMNQLCITKLLQHVMLNGDDLE